MNNFFLSTAVHPIARTQILPRMAKSSQILPRLVESNRPSVGTCRER